MPLGVTVVSDLVQIVYVSRSTFTSMPAAQGIEPSMARILAQSRINNARRGLVGALYFGDGCFFQCLEGRADESAGMAESSRAGENPDHRTFRPGHTCGPSY